MKSPHALLNLARQMSVWSTWDTRTRRFAAAAAVVLVASIVYAYILKTGIFGAGPVTIIDDLGEALAAAIASGACAWAATRVTGREHLGWTLMSISTGLWAAGELVWSYYEVWQQVTVPYPSLADAGFLGAVPFAIGGIRAFWAEAARGTSTRWRVWFDSHKRALALTCTAWPFGLREVYQSGSS